MEFCDIGFTKLCGIKRARMKRLSDHAKTGAAAPPTDRRHSVTRRPRHGRNDKKQDVDNFLQWCYTSLAEYLPEGVDKGDHEVSMKFLDLPPAEGHPLPQMSMAAGSSADDEVLGSGLRYLPPMTPAMLYDLYCSHGGTACRTTFDKVYKQRWSKKGLLQIRRWKQHNVCNECTKFKLQRANAKTPAEHAKVTQAYKEHLDSMYADRVVDARLCKLSCLATAEFAEVLPEVSVASICLDAMDQSKFRVPRGGLATKAKEVAAMWKPCLHLVGCVFDGVRDMYYLLDADTAKDSNCSLTCLSRTLEVGSQELTRRGTAMPLQLHVRSDNGNAEAKNQVVMKWCAWNVLRQAFANIVLGQFRPGHAHFRVDQKLSVVRGT